MTEQMSLADWGARVANWKKRSASKKPLVWHTNHLASEAIEVFGELRRIEEGGKLPKGLKGASPYSVITMGEKDGSPHPEGFGIELADVILVALYIAEVTGVDIEEQMRIKMQYNEQRRAK